KINQNTSFALSSVFVVSSGKDLEEALTNNALIIDSLESLKGTGVIQEYYNINELILTKDQQEEKIRKWNLFWDKKKNPLISKLTKQGEEVGYKPVAFKTFAGLLNKNFEPLSIEKFYDIIGSYFQDYLIQRDEKSAVITMIKVDRLQKNRIRNIIVEFDNSYFFDRQEFAESLFNLIKSQFRVLIWLSMAIVFIILLLSLGRIELVFISFVPIVLSWIWTIGIMGIFNLQFNIFNIIISTFIFGLGVDYSIFITKGLLHKIQFNKDNFKSFKTSVLLSGFTTIIGTGILLFAKHPALKSIALVSVIGILSAIIISFTIQPLLFNFLTYYRGKKRKMPVTFYNLFFGIVSLIYFLLSSTFSILMAHLLNILPIKSSIKKKFAHQFIWFFSKTVVYWNLHVRKILVNFSKKTFKQPMLIISNHQSVLDLVFLLMLHPKIVIFANDRALNHRFYGPVIRFVDFIPSSDGLEKTAERVKERMNEGYSVLIFPEGTRSANCKIKRFHKGAFYLANKLDLEIHPILMHGPGQALNKNEFFLRRGRVVIKMLDKINLKSGTFGSDYSQQTKGVLKFMRKEYDKLRLEMEVPDRLKFNLINRYIFRGPVLEWYLRVKLSLEKNYNFMNEIVPRNGIITDVGCGYGFMATMLALTSEERKITGFDYDKDKIITAQNSTFDIKNLTFEHGNITAMNLPESDVFLIVDVLHYMAAKKQTELIERCFSKLNKHGLIIIRETDTDLKRRTIGSRFSEFMSTNIGFNKAEEKLIFVSRQFILDIVRKNGGSINIIDNTKFNSNIIYVLSK
ncbi:MAG: 1-acyl-sn-glycerol-3-phosphate acyltransferase, partial [Bacteroidales bacterium]|nr:1-acyl-sn-glycerol-3-phosphate acyltransferase [Bacteroidales bacterium]